MYRFSLAWTVVTGCAVTVALAAEEAGGAVTGVAGEANDDGVAGTGGGFDFVATTGMAAPAAAAALGG